MAHTARLACVGILLLAACGQNGRKQPCTSMMGTSELVKNAKSFQVTVYAGTVDCAAPTGTPEKDKRFQSADTIELDVKAGAHTVIVIAYSDTAGTVPIGRACVQGNFDKGSQLCFDLVVDPVVDLAVSDLPVDAGKVDAAMPDLSVFDEGAVDATVIDAILPPDQLPPPDMVPVECTFASDCSANNNGHQCIDHHCGCNDKNDCPANNGCCGGQCISIHTNTNCGDCGVACDGDHTNPAGNSCATGVCVLQCMSGYAMCDANSTNGCETSIADSTINCGACGRICSSTNVATPACAGGVCTSSCDTGFLNCKKPTAGADDDGCECADHPSAEADGAKCCGASKDGCLVTHDVGDTGNTHWYDCVAKNTYNVEQATRACNAYKSSGSCTTKVCPSSGSAGTDGHAICGQDGGFTRCWQYDGDAVGKTKTNNGMGQCPATNDGPWG